MGKSLGGETEVQMSDPLMREAVRMVGQEVCCGEQKRKGCQLWTVSHLQSYAKMSHNCDLTGRHFLSPFFL